MASLTPSSASDAPSRILMPIIIIIIVAMRIDRAHTTRARKMDGLRGSGHSKRVSECKMDRQAPDKQLSTGQLQQKKLKRLTLFCCAPQTQSECSLIAALAASTSERNAKESSSPAKRRILALFWEFSLHCPQPALVKRSFVVSWRKRETFFHPRVAPTPAPAAAAPAAPQRRLQKSSCFKTQLFPMFVPSLSW